MPHIFDKSYWEKRWQEQKIGWDIGYVSPAIKDYTEQLTDKSIKILIPGAGNGYEAEYLYKKGFSNVFYMDYAPSSVTTFLKRVPDFPENKILRK